MLNRTLFYGLPPIGVGTPEVESLPAYVRRLAFAHSLRPTTLMRHLFAAMPPDVAKRKPAENAMQDCDFGPISGPGILSRLETATGVALAPTTTLRFARILAIQGLVRDNDCTYCPLCVKETDGIAHGRLAWELSAVTACCRHGVRLRSGRVCGGPLSERLGAARSPSLNCVCKSCGSIGFDCVKDIPEAASHFEVWTAKQVGELVATPTETIQDMSTETVRAGLAATVAAAFGGSVVLAARQANLARSSVCVWIRGDIVPSLPGLARLCYAAGANLAALMAGRFDKLAVEHGAHDASAIPRRRYRKTELSNSEIRAATLAAAKEAVPPSPAALAERLGLEKTSIRIRFPVEASVLLAAHREYKVHERQLRYESAVQAYASAADALQLDGRVVCKKYLQRVSGLSAFRTNELRSLAMDEVMNRFNPTSNVQVAA